MSKLKISGSIFVLLALALLIAWCDGRPQANHTTSRDVPPAKKERPRPEHHRPPPVEAVSVSENESTWKESDAGGEVRVRKTLKMTAVPTVSESSTTATADVSITVTTGANVWDPEAGGWRAMSQEQLKSWGQARDHHSATATIVKEIDPKSNQPVITSQFAVGDGSEEPTSEYNETESGINITLNWNGDKLKISWTNSGLKQMDEEVVIPYSKRFQARNPNPPNTIDSGTPARR